MLDSLTKAPEPAPSKLHEQLCRVAIVGFGTVGSSVARILSERAPAGLLLTHVYNRTATRKQQASWLPSRVKWTQDIQEVLSSDVDVVVEVIGGLSPAGDWIRSALNSGKSVVTANKQLIAQCGPELIALARKQKRHLAFGASVAGGVPVISGLQEGLAGDELFKIYGILNGTCNYILSQIESAGVSFSTALEEAQRLGFAEADPTDDIDGFDARAKLAILARVGLRSHAEPKDILCRSISTIEAVDFDYARQLGYTIRQISWAELESAKPTSSNRPKEVGSHEPAAHLLASVQPALVGLSSPLARVQGAQNLVMSTGRSGGETVFGGHGAGGNPTAVAIVSDIVGIAKAKQGAPLGFEMAVTPRQVTADFTTKHYLRFTVKDRPGIIATLASIFSECGINIDSVLQKPGYLKSSLPFVITLESCKASLVDKARAHIAETNFLVQPCVYLPILD